MKNFIFTMGLVSASLNAAQASDSLKDVGASYNKAMQRALFEDYSQKEINNIVATSAEETYKSINENWTYIPAGKNQKPSTSSDYWQAKFIPQTVILNGEEAMANLPTLLFKGRPEDFAANLDDLVSKPAVLECTTALTAVKIIALKDIMGDDVFLEYVSYFKEEMTKRNWPADHFFSELPELFLKDDRIEKAETGHMTYISNLFYYSHFKRNGNSRGFNVVQVAQNSYLSFGDFFKEGPATFETIRDHNRAEFCQTTDVEHNHAHHARICDVIKSSPDQFNRDYESSQKNNPTLYFDAGYINEFMRERTLSKVWRN